MINDEVFCRLCGHRIGEKVVYIRDYKRSDLLSHGLSEKFVDFVFSEPRTGLFQYRCEDKVGGWPCYLPENVSVAYPLWCCNGDPTVYWVREGNREFVWLCHDDPSIDRIASTEQGLLARLFVGLMESQDWKEPDAAIENLRAAAEIAGFRYVDELNEFHKVNGSDPNFDNKLQQFVDSLS